MRLSSIVPHTSEETTIASFEVGQAVNLEVDILARYMERLLTGRQSEPSSGLTMEFLQQNGFSFFILRFESVKKLNHRTYRSVPPRNNRRYPPRKNGHSYG